MNDHLSCHLVCTVCLPPALTEVCLMMMDLYAFPDTTSNLHMLYMSQKQPSATQQSARLTTPKSTVTYVDRYTILAGRPRVTVFFSMSGLLLDSFKYIRIYWTLTHTMNIKVPCLATLGSISMFFLPHNDILDLALGSETIQSSI